MRLSQEEWAEHVAAWESSGSSVAEYCRPRGLKPSTFRYWSSRIRGSRKETREKPSFARVVRTSPEPGSGSAEGSGVRVTVGPASLELTIGFDEETFSRVLRVLAAREAGR